MAAYLRSNDAPQPLREGLDRLRDELDVPAEFPAEVLAEARASADGVVLPERDATDIPLVTIDPPGSTDLDQALFIERDGEGYRVVYAIADLERFVTPGGAVDAEAHARGVTLYAPDGRTPLHPPELSEGAASLLPDQLRPALLWEHTLDASGAVVASRVEPARVRSRAQLTYEQVQASIDDGSAEESLQLLREVGGKREALERERGGVSLQIPEQEVEVDDGGWKLRFRSTLPVEGWNAQISLLTGLAAADLMLKAGIGVLRTLPPARQADVDRLRRVAKALGFRWPGSVSYPEFVRSLDPAKPRDLAMLNACTTLFRGAGYAVFDGAPPEQPLHGAMNTPYAHCTAPLRRLVDRYANAICVAVSAGAQVPQWARDGLAELPSAMGKATQRANAYERGILGLVEALVLSSHVGQTFVGTVVDVNDRSDRAELQLTDPAVSAPMTGDGAELGSETSARLVEADVVAGTVLFEHVGGRLAPRTSRPGDRGARASRKVRTPQGKVVGNAHPG